MTHNKVRRILYKNNWRFKAPLRFVTPEEIEFMERVFNREDGLHKMGLSLEWAPIIGLKEFKVSFHVNEDIPVNRFANLYERQDENEDWQCTHSGDGTWPEQIVFWVETYYQQELGMGYWEHGEHNDAEYTYSVFVPTTPEYFLSLEKEEQLKWGAFFNDKYRSRLTREIIGITTEHIQEMNNINTLIGG